MNRKMRWIRFEQIIYFVSFNEMQKVLSIDVGTKNLGMCILRYDPDRSPFPYAIEDWKKINLKARTTSEATESMVKTFLKYPPCYDVNYVVIESQERAVEKMKRLSNAIQSHFETARIIKEKPYTVCWSSGDVKLRVYDGPETWSPIKTRSKYLMNKALGEVHTQAILTQGVEKGYPDYIKWMSWYQKLSKQDDAADCFLQGAFFLKRLKDPTILISHPKKRKNDICLIQIPGAENPPLKKKKTINID